MKTSQNLSNDIFVVKTWQSTLTDAMFLLNKHAVTKYMGCGTSFEVGEEAARYIFKKIKA